MGWKDEMNNNYDEDLFGKSSSKNDFGFEDNNETEQYRPRSSGGNNYNKPNENLNKIKSYIIVIIALIFVINICIVMYLLNSRPSQSDFDIKRVAFDNEVQNLMDETLAEQDRLMHQINRPYNYNRRDSSDSQQEINTIEFGDDDSENGNVRRPRRPRRDTEQLRPNDSGVESILFGEEDTSKKVVPVANMFEPNPFEPEDAQPEGVAAGNSDTHNANMPKSKRGVSFNESSTFTQSASDDMRNNIEAVFRKKRGDITDCYEREISSRDKATGRLSIVLIVGKDGRTMKVDKTEDEIGGQMFQCVKQKILEWQFGTLEKPVSFKKTWVFN